MEISEKEDFQNTTSEEKVEDYEAIEDIEDTKTEISQGNNSESPLTDTKSKQEIKDESDSIKLSPEELMIQKGHEKLNSVSKEESLFRSAQYKILGLVLKKRLHCTICDDHIGCKVDGDFDPELYSHPMLKVLCCLKCIESYNEVKFKLSDAGKDTVCRWCTKGPTEQSPLRFCKICPFSFCETCIFMNLPLDEFASSKENWSCFVCNIKDLWPSRAVLWALKGQVHYYTSRFVKSKDLGDMSSCCGNMNAPSEASKEKSNPPVRGKFLSVKSPAELCVPRVLTPAQKKQGVGNIPFAVVNHVQSTAPKRNTKPPPKPLKTKPLPASLTDASCLKTKLDEVYTVIDTLNGNLARVANGIPDIDDKFNIKSKLIFLTSLLNIGSNQIRHANKEIQNTFDILEQDKREKTANKFVGESEEGDVVFDTKNDLNDFYKNKYNAQPCNVQLDPTETTAMEQDEEPVVLDDDDDEGGIDAMEFVSVNYG